MKAVEKSLIKPNNQSRQNDFKFSSDDIWRCMEILNEFRTYCGKPELDKIDLDDITVINFWLDLTIAGQAKNV